MERAAETGNHAGDTGELSGRTALVTGATGDLGRAVSCVLAAAGADVHAVGRRAGRLQELSAARITGHNVDLVDTAAVERLLQAVGPVAILVLAHAHPPEAAPFLTGGMDKLRPIMDVNFFVPAHLVLATLPGMLERGWGRVIAISSLAAAIGEAHGPSYCASKAALEGLMRNLAIDYSAHGVTFNSVEPGPVMTERLQGWGPTKARRLALASAVRRVAQPEDVAHAVGFLASPRASHITGEELRVDGGLHLGNAFATAYVRPGSQEHPGP